MCIYRPQHDSNKILLHKCYMHLTTCPFFIIVHEWAPSLFGVDKTRATAGQFVCPVRDLYRESFLF